MAKTIALSLAAQTKMALHAAKHGLGTPVHGIVLGTPATGSGGGGRLDVTDVVPVCHEVPTKPLADAALRLTDARLEETRRKDRIVGWYTANARCAPPTPEGGGEGGEEEEGPNAPACRIAASMAEAAGGDEGTTTGGSDGFVLLLVSTARLADRVGEKGRDGTTRPMDGPLCRAFERNQSRAFAREVDAGRVISAAGNDATGRALSEALGEIAEYRADGGVVDFVDHLEDGGRGDWIDNEFVNDFVRRR